MPSLLAVAAVDHPGGAEIALERLLPRLRALGWHVTHATPGGELSLPVGGLARGAGARAVASWPKARRFAALHDVVYLNGTVAARLLPALPSGVHVVLHVHDLVDRVPRMWARADVVLAPSQAVAERLGPLTARTYVVGAPIESHAPVVAPPWPLREGVPVIGYVGRIEPRKGVMDLVRAAPRLREAGARVVVIGDDPYGADPGYLAQVRSSTDVECYGWVDGAAGLMGSLDVLVLPSHAEPWGAVLAEAMAAGTPVVATRVDGIPEVVEDGVTGRLVAPGDPAALADAVLEVLGRREEMGAAGREHARRWQADDYARNVAELITP